MGCCKSIVVKPMPGAEVEREGELRSILSRKSSLHLSKLDSPIKSTTALKEIMMKSHDDQEQRPRSHLSVGIPQTLEVKKAKFVFNDDSSLPKIVVRHYKSRNQSESPSKLKKKQSELETNTFTPSTAHPLTRQDIIKQSKVNISITSQSNKPQSRDILGGSKDDRLDLLLGGSTPKSRFRKIDSNVEKEMLAEEYHSRNRLGSGSNKFTAEWGEKFSDNVGEDGYMMTPSSKKQSLHRLSEVTRKSGNNRGVLSITFQKVDESRFTVNDSEGRNRRSESHLGENQVAPTFGNRSIEVNERPCQPSVHNLSIDFYNMGLRPMEDIGLRVESSMTKLDLYDDHNHVRFKRYKSDQWKTKGSDHNESLKVSGHSSHSGKEVEVSAKGVSAQNAISKFSKKSNKPKKRGLLRLPSELLVGDIRQQQTLQIEKQAKEISQNFIICQENEGIPWPRIDQSKEDIKNSSFNEGSELLNDEKEKKISSKSRKLKQIVTGNNLSPILSNLTSPEIARRKRSFNAKENLFQKVNSNSVSVQGSQRDT